MIYEVTHTTVYPGGHAADPGYRWVAVRALDGRAFGFYCDPDGSNVRRIGTRPADEAASFGFRKLSARNAAARAPDLERAIKAHLASVSAAA